MKHAAVILCFGMWLSALAVPQMVVQTEVIDETVTDTYFSAETGQVRALGVCNLLKSQAECWDTDGHPSAELSKLVMEELHATAIHNGVGPVEIPLVYRQKNRVVIFDVPNPASGKVAGLFTGVFMTSGFRPMPLRFYSDPQVDRRIEMVPVHVGAAEKSVSMLVQFNVPLSGSTVLEAKPGSSAEWGGLRLSIGNFVSDSESGFPMMVPGPTWRATISAKGKDYVSRLHPNLSPISNEGQNITSLDSKGRPSKSGVLPKMPANPYDTSDPKFVMLSVNTNYEESIHGWQIYSNADPQAISRYRVAFSQDRTIRFTKIPLDPIR